MLFPNADNNEYNVTIYSDNSVVAVYINDKIAYTTRVYSMAKKPWSINCYSGSLEVTDIKVAGF